MAAVFEAVLGQLYLITVVALVVQNLSSQSRVGRRMKEEEEALAERQRGRRKAPV